MAKREHLKILKQGVKIWNRWREDNPEIEPDLSSIHLSNLELEGINLISANLDETSIVACNLGNVAANNARMYGTALTGVQLVEANLSRSHLTLTIFTLGSLEKANLEGSQIVGSVFYNVNLKDTDFSNASVAANSFSNVELNLAKGLESVRHGLPSSISIDTLYKSAGKIPEAFLRGCGIPDDFITFIPAHFGIQQAIQFYSCFISYSTKDEEFARKLHSRMRDENLRVWFAPEDIKGGEKLFEQIERAIQIHDRLLIILSEESMRSEWVLTEIRRARKVEIEQKRRKLFPIRLVDFEAIQNWERIDHRGVDIAEEVQSYYIPDFSDWKNHDSFEKGFARLLKDLRDEEARQSRA